MKALIEQGETHLARRVAKLNKRELNDAELISLVKNVAEDGRINHALRVAHGASSVVQEAFWSYIREKHPQRMISVARTLDRELIRKEIDDLIKFFEQKGLNGQHFLFSKKIPNETKEKLLVMFEWGVPDDTAIARVIKEKLTPTEIQLMLKTAYDEKRPMDVLLLLHVTHQKYRKIPTKEIRKLAEII